MEVEFEDLKRKVNGLNLSEWENIEYRGRTFHIIPDVPHGEGLPAEWFKSTHYDGADVYIWENIPDDFKRSIIIHEIIEADLRLNQRVDCTKAHEAATDYDRRYASLTLDEQRYRQYENERNRLLELVK